MQQILNVSTPPTGTEVEATQGFVAWLELPGRALAARGALAISAGY